jgi:HEAT repeat protein
MRGKWYPSNNRWAERRRRKDKHVSSAWLLRQLRSPDPQVRFQAVSTLKGINEARICIISALRYIAFHDPDYWVRESAAYVLSFAWNHHWTARPLLALYKKPGEHPLVRAQAAEGLANKYDLVRPWKSGYLPAMKSLLVGLRDASPQVRFWSAFALGNMRAREALPELRRLAATDREICPGWWTVGEEATDAIVTVTGEGLRADREMRRDTLTAEDFCPYTLP